MYVCMNSFKPFDYKSTNQLNDEMTAAVAAAKAASAEAAAQAKIANALLAEIKGRKVAVVEYIDAANPALGTADVLAYQPDGNTVLNLARVLPNLIKNAGSTK